MLVDLLVGKRKAYTLTDEEAVYNWSGASPSPSALTEPNPALTEEP